MKKNVYLKKFTSFTFCKYVLFIFTLLLVSCNNNPVPEEEPDYFPEYITEVFEYVYAPGQHAGGVNKTDGQNFIGKPSVDVLLGGFGGYIVAGFDHNVMNRDGYDFEVFSVGVDAEPAIIYVMCDENGDGKPNETWYELKGSRTGKEGTMQNYSVTYYKPADKDSNIKWKDNRNKTGELISGFNGNTSFSWWWQAESDSVTFIGTRLPDAYINIAEEEKDGYWVVPDTMFLWGYAENIKGEDYSFESQSNKVDISNAINDRGETVVLEHIRFIKVQTGVFQQAGRLNEISSEVKGARDLHY